MSQSDYIKHKKNATILKRQNDLEIILNSQDFTNYKEFELLNTIKNTLHTPNQLTETNKHKIFKIEKNATNCARFIVCSTPGGQTTNDRPNRVLTMTDLMGKRGYKRRNAYQEYFINQKVNNLIMPCKMFAECDRYFYLRENPYIDDEDETEIIIGM